MKRVLFAVALAAFLGSAVAMLRVELRADAYGDSGAVVARLLRQEQPEQTVQLQHDLARWYNLNLTAARQDPDFRDAYWSILNLEADAFGVLSVPSLGLRLPIRHGADAAAGAGHIPGTAFPLGQAGEHSALTVPVALKQGTYFYIHILHQVLAYRVTDAYMGDMGDLDGDSGTEETVCTLVCPAPEGVLLLRGELAPDAPSEQSVTVELQPEQDGWLSAACVVMAMGILLVPFLMWCRKP